MNPLCLLLSDDLIDASRVVGHGRAAGLNVVHCRDVAKLLAEITRQPAVVILDLHFPALDLEAIVPTVQACGSKLIGFGAHVDATRLKAARQAGCDEVLPRSAFFEGLEAKLAAWASIN